MSDQPTSHEKQVMETDRCENCGEQLHGDYCSSCGQSIQTSFRFFGTILMDLLDNLFSYDSRVYRTLVPLMLRPGYVCHEYLSGKRASYLPPFRLYLFASIVFFLLVPLVNNISVSLDLDDSKTSTTTGAEEDVASYLALNKGDSSADMIAIKKEPSEVNTDIPFFIEERKVMRDKFYSITEQDSEALREISLNALPTVMFFLLPLLALTLKFLYLFSKRYYMEHMVVVLFSQSYLFFMLLFTVSLEKGHDLLIAAFPSMVLFHTLATVIVTICYFWMPVHIFLFLKNVYGQSTMMTLAKISALTLVYLTLTGLAFFMTIVWGVFNI